MPHLERARSCSRSKRRRLLSSSTTSPTPLLVLEKQRAKTLHCHLVQVMHPPAGNEIMLQNLYLAILPRKKLHGSSLEKRETQRERQKGQNPRRRIS